MVRSYTAKGELRNLTIKYGGVCDEAQELEYQIRWDERSTH